MFKLQLRKMTKKILCHNQIKPTKKDIIAKTTMQHRQFQKSAYFDELTS